MERERGGTCSEEAMCVLGARGSQMKQVKIPKITKMLIKITKQIDTKRFDD